MIDKAQMRGEIFHNQSSLFFRLKLQLHDAIYRLRFYLNSLIPILSLSNSHSNLASIQKNRADKSHRIIVALFYLYIMYTYDVYIYVGIFRIILD